MLQEFRITAADEFIEQRKKSPTKLPGIFLRNELQTIFAGMTITSAVTFAKLFRTTLKFSAERGTFHGELPIFFRLVAVAQHAVTIAD